MMTGLVDWGSARSSLMDLEQLKIGCETAWNDAYPVLWGVVLSAIYGKHLGLSKEDQEDVAVSSISMLMAEIHRANDTQHLKFLLAHIAQRQAISLKRKQSAQKRRDGNVQSLDAEIEAHGEEILRGKMPTPADMASMADDAARLHAALREVRESYRQILKDHYFDGLDYRELAAKHGLAENTVGVYLKRGREELRVILERCKIC